ncbi:GTP 3',8-cyclase MoaA [Romboutsia sp.]|uniref:GTP 3',8-cyclase MoaA n=1 Tax=Romboutsia sp. TaxID=1965302 RepID=UPI003F2C3CD2
MIDFYGRKINYLRMSITDNCNLKCKYCMPEVNNNNEKHDILSSDEIYKIASDMVDLGIDKIRITGGEPLARKDSLEIIKRVGSLNLKDFTITTNGVLLKKYASKLKEYGVKRVNISLDSLDSNKYKEITRGGNLQNVLDGIEECKKVGLTPIKINVVLIGGFNEDEINKLVNLTVDDEIDVRFIELMPIGQAQNWSIEKFISSNVILEKVKRLKRIDCEEQSSPATYYKLEGAKGRVGIINPISCKFCDKCNRLRVTYDGKLKLCLHSDDEIDLKSAIESKIDLKQLILKSVNEKPKEHNLEKGQYIKRDMVKIGG